MTNKNELSLVSTQLPEPYESLLENGLYPADEGREHRILISLACHQELGNAGGCALESVGARVFTRSQQLLVKLVRAAVLTAALVTAGPQVLRFVFGIWFATAAH